MFEVNPQPSSLAERTIRAANDLAEAVSVAPPQGAPQPSSSGGAPPPGSGQPSAPGGLGAAGPPPPPTPPAALNLAVNPPRDLAMANLQLRPSTQNPIMGGIGQPVKMAKGGLVSLRTPRFMVALKRHNSSVDYGYAQGGLV